MTKDEVAEIRIDVDSDGQSALSMMLHRDGTIGRHGKGAIPNTDSAVLGMTDGRYFNQVLETIPDEALAHAREYDHPNKQGMILAYSIVFLGPRTEGPTQPPMAGVRVVVGSENQDVPSIVNFIDALVVKSVDITDPWYLAVQEGKRGEDVPGGM